MNEKKARHVHVKANLDRVLKPHRARQAKKKKSIWKYRAGGSYRWFSVYTYQNLPSTKDRDTAWGIFVVLVTFSISFMLLSTAADKFWEYSSNIEPSDSILSSIVVSLRTKYVSGWKSPGVVSHPDHALSTKRDWYDRVTGTCGSGLYWKKPIGSIDINSSCRLRLEPGSTETTRDEDTVRRLCPQIPDCTYRDLTTGKNYRWAVILFSVLIAAWVTRFNYRRRRAY